MLCIAQPLNLVNLLQRQFERRGAQIIAQPRSLPARGNRHNPLIHAPPQTDLPLADIVLLRQLRHVLVDGPGLGLGDSGKGPVGGGGDVGGGVLVGEEIAVLEVRVVFDLVDGWRDRGRCEGGLEVRLQVVGYAYRLGFVGFLDGFHFRPGALEVGGGFGEDGGVDEVACEGHVSWLIPSKFAGVVHGNIQVNIVESELLQTRVDGFRDVGDVGDDFGCDEELLSRHVTLLDCGADFAFRVVDFRSVDVVVAQLDGCFDGFDELAVGFAVVGKLKPGGPGAVAKLEVAC